jgi:arginine:pyruvate transaminase
MPGSSFGENARDLVRISLTVPDEKIELSCERLNRFINGII